MKNVFVMGLDELNHLSLRSLPSAEDCVFHQLLTQDELQGGTISVPDLLGAAQRRLDDFPGSVDAIVGYWDFPVPMMVAILCARYGLPSADLEAVVRCEHKYWSRLEQQKAIDEVPAFGLIPATEGATLPAHLGYPVWVKPVKSASSEGAHYVTDDVALAGALAAALPTVDRIGGPFEEILAMVDLPAEVAAAGGRAFIAEEAVTGRQLTVEGFSRHGRVEVYGVVDSMHVPGTQSFLRYQYPSGLPQDVQDHVADLSVRVISHMGLTNSTFNIEYFWDPQTGRVALLEINARHSQSHALLFQLVDGAANHLCMVDLALDRDPRMPHRQGRCAIAAKWFVRRFTDGVVRRVPSQEDVAALEREMPGTTARVVVSPGARLSEQRFEDSYSHVLAQIYTGGRDEDELREQYARYVEGLEFVVDDGAV
ncbi:ATP-grasp domain-containing protein [Georgenia sp. H159]|uniref:ATP-grasp domain-containing protein n=1 Tax=Georgenia sp. H159 TaxID=3076115 RepID=UPI002D7665B9|nr:ATP-grasp domain-containing protein [Georgenia sp. H159]